METQLNSEASSELPFMALTTIAAMLGGFLLLFLIPINGAIAWASFSGFEASACFPILRRIIRLERNLKARKIPIESL